MQGLGPMGMSSTSVLGDSKATLSQQVAMEHTRPFLSLSGICLPQSSAFSQLVLGFPAPEYSDPSLPGSLFKVGWVGI